MPTTGVINTTLLAISKGGVKYAHSTNATISFSMSPRDTTSKDSGGHRTLLEGLRQATISGSGFYAMDAAEGADDIYTDLQARDTVELTFSTGVIGDKIYTVTAYLSELTLTSADAEANADFSFTAEVTGPPAVATVA